jgi:hypothetical protein
MAEDDGTQDPPAGEAKVSLSQIKDAVREVLGEMDLGGKPPDPASDPSEDDDRPVYSVRQAEDLARRTVEEAMRVLDAKPKPKKPAAPKGDEEAGGDGGESGSGSSKPKEPAPTPPKETLPAWRLRLRDVMVGKD